MELTTFIKRCVQVTLLLSCFFIAKADALDTLDSFEKKMSLDGLWYFKTLEDVSIERRLVHPDSVGTEGWDSLTVPGNWDMENKYANYRGTAVYRRSVTPPADWKGGLIRIRLEAVNETARVYVNGAYVGSHRGGYTPFEFNVGDLIHRDSVNTIAVVADNHYGRGAWWAWGGISRPISLIYHQAIRIKQLKVTAQPDLQTKHGQVLLQCRLENKDKNPKQLAISTLIYPEGKKEMALQERVDRSIQLAGMADTLEEMQVKLTRPIDLWHFDHPTLYVCEVSVYQGDTLLYRKEARFGFREVEAKAGQIYLNGEPVRLTGFNRVHDHRAFGNTEPFHLIKRDLDDMKRMGCQMTRMMHAPLAPELLDYADEIGMLIIQEVPVWGREDPQAYKDNPIVRSWLKEMIDRDYNHPSVIAWSVANELVLDVKDWTKLRMSKEQHDYVSSMIRYVREELDATRLLTYVSLSAFRPTVTSDDDPAGLCDFICFNNYGDFVGAAKEIHKKWPDKAVFVSEFGKEQIGSDSDASLAENVLSQLKELGNLPYVAGASLWSYNDYRSAFPGTPLGGDRTWGVVDVWRQPKKAARQIEQAFSPVKTIKADWQTDGGELLVHITARKKEELPAYILKGYHLKYELLAKNGEVIQTDSSLLKDIYPGDSQQTVRFNYSHKKIHPYAIRLQLLNPIQQVVHEQHIYGQLPDQPSLRYTASSADTARFMFFPASGAEAYRIAVEGMDTIETIKTWVDIPIDRLAKGEKVSVQAKNHCGLSKPLMMSVAKKGLPLAPIIRALVPVNEALVVGFSVKDTSQQYILQLRSPQHKDKTMKEVKTSLVGSVKIPISASGDYEVRIKRVTDKGESQWSPWEKISMQRGKRMM